MSTTLLHDRFGSRPATDDVVLATAQGSTTSAPEKTLASPPLPAAKGALSATIIAALRSAPGTEIRLPSIAGRDMLSDDDAQLALTCCYELAYSGFRGVDDDWELDPALLQARTQLERAFLQRLADEVEVDAKLSAAEAIDLLRELATSNGGPSLSGWVSEHGTIEHLREFCIHRSQYQLKEADPHSWVIPRLRGRAKAAFVTIQFDEYGGGQVQEMHAELFATTMRALALDDRPGVHLDRLPAATLATGNLVTMFGLHRRWRAAAVGHLALFEMTSVGPMRRYSEAFTRLGLSASARRFYEVHVTADALHEKIALDEMVTGLLDQEPATAADVVFGARALSLVESRFTGALLEAWNDGGTALRPSPASSTPAAPRLAVTRP